jgi:hypothetical protein
MVAASAAKVKTLKQDLRRISALLRKNDSSTPAKTGV